MKYYRVKKDTFMWDKGAILSSSGDGYRPISELFNHVDIKGEYISDHIIENPENAEFFERVYEVNTLTKVLYETKDKARELLARDFKSE